MGAALATFGSPFAASASATFSSTELRELYRGTRAQAMGNAFVAVADDEEAIYYNPAGLAGIESGTIKFFDLSTEVSTDTITTASSSASTFSNLSADSLNSVMGRNIHGRGTFAPSYVTTHFGLSVLVDQQVALYAKNKALPDITLGYQTTNGIQMSYGFALNGGKYHSGRGEFRLGMGLKLLTRRGGYYTLTETQVINASQNTLKQIVGDFGTGLGWDLGTQYLFHLNGQLTLMSGAAFTEVGGVSFGNDTSQPLPGNLSLGVALRYQFSRISTTLAYDIRHLTQSTDPRLRNHFGMEFSIPVFKLYLGVNQIYPTFGVGVDVWFFKVMAVSYAEELSALAKIDPERRYLVNVSMSL